MRYPRSTGRSGSLARLIGRLRSRAGREEAGFTLVEFLAALGILFVALLALVHTATVAFSDVALGRQRQTANQMANQMLEEVRGLPYATLEKGLADADLGGDTNIVLCAGEYYFKVCPPTPGAEKIIHTPGLPGVSPLVPHRGTFGPPDYPGTFSWSVYVTEATNVPSEGAYRVTAIVSWTQTVRAGVRNRIEAQTLIYSPEGCVDTLTHPFGAPCQPYFFVNGFAGGGGVGSTGAVDGLSFDAMGVDLMRQLADVQVEQVSRVGGSLLLPSGFQVVGGTRSVTGSSGSSVADTDPSTPPDAYDTRLVGPQGPGSLVISGGGNEVSVSLGGSDQGSTTSTTAAGGANSCNLQSDGRPCGYGTGTAAGAVSHRLSLANNIGVATLASVAPSGVASTTYVRRLAPVADEDGLVRGQISWRLPEVRIGGLPDNVDPPVNWAGYWVRLTGLTATATAEAGTSSSAPAIAITVGQVEYWNGAGYTPAPVTLAGGAIPVFALDHTDQVSGDDVQVQISGALSTQPSTTSQTILGGTTRTEAIARIGSPIIGNFTYKVFRNGVPVADLTVAVGLGRAGVNAIYKPAPTP